MNLLLLYAASVIGAFIGWYACGPIKTRSVRCVARAGLIAFLCAPGVVVGHGIGVVPTLFALIVQPPFALISIGITWLIALVPVFGVPALREHKNEDGGYREWVFSEKAARGFCEDSSVTMGVIIYMWTLHKLAPRGGGTRTVSRVRRARRV